ncbi:MAG: hypothetical protein WD049_00435 [Candidatus Paceibacterota bacterium]
MGKFVILSDCRCGGTTLTETLDQHPQLNVHGEVLLSMRLGQRPRSDWPDWPALVAQAFDHCDGFHLQRYQLPWHRDPWNAFAAYPDLRVIDLRRLDLLQQYASWRVAMATQQWRERPESLPRLTWNEDDFRKTASAWEEGRAYTDRAFAGLPQLKLTFQDLCDDFGGTIYRCQRFLGIEPTPLKPSQPRNPKLDYADVFFGWPAPA